MAAPRATERGSSRTSWPTKLLRNHVRPDAHLQRLVVSEVVHRARHLLQGRLGEAEHLIGGVAHIAEGARRRDAPDVKIQPPLHLDEEVAI